MVLTSYAEEVTNGYFYNRNYFLTLYVINHNFLGGKDHLSFGQEVLKYNKNIDFHETLSGLVFDIWMA